MNYSAKCDNYDEKLAYDYMLCSGLAYCDAADIMAGKCHQATALTTKAGIVPLHAMNNRLVKNKITYFIAKRDSQKELIIGFSGTTNKDQLIDEIKEAIPVLYSIHGNKAKVYNYFYSHYVTGFRDDLLKSLKAYADEYKDYRIVFTGHSLGGALTVHAAADSILSGIAYGHKVYVYTFGQPRVGDPTFTGLFYNRVDSFYRLVHNRDLVAHMPPCFQTSLIVAYMME